MNKKTTAHKLQAPIELNMTVHLTNGEGTSCEIVIGLGLGNFPTEEEMRAAIQKHCLDNPDLKNFRLMTKREWWREVGPRVPEMHEDGDVVMLATAAPGGDDWDA